MSKIYKTLAELDGAIVESIEQSHRDGINEFVHEAAEGLELSWSLGERENYMRKIAEDYWDPTSAVSFAIKIAGYDNVKLESSDELIAELKRIHVECFEDGGTQSGSVPKNETGGRSRPRRLIEG